MPVSTGRFFAACALTGVVAAGATYGLTRPDGLIKRPTPRADLRNDEALEVAMRRTQEILEARDNQMPLEYQHEMMKFWHDLKIWQNMWYLGIRIQKNPCDLWMMQQIIFDVQPDYIIEAGTNYGGSAVFWAHILDGLGLEDSKVLTIDIADEQQADAAKLPLWKKYVEFFHASSTDPDLVAKIGERVRGKKVLVTLDSNHERDHVLNELRAWGPLVSPGSYIVVEDTNMDGVPVSPQYGPGPMTAVVDYLAEGGDELFEQDLSREALVLTFNGGGWLKRKAPTPSVGGAR